MNDLRKEYSSDHVVEKLVYEKGKNIFSAMLRSKDYAIKKKQRMMKDGDDEERCQK